MSNLFSNYFTLNQGVFLGLGYLLSIIHLNIIAKNKDFKVAMFFNIAIILGLVSGRMFYNVLFDNKLNSMFQGNSILASIFICTIILSIYYQFNKQVVYLVNEILPYLSFIQILGKIGCYFGACCNGEVNIFGNMIPLQLFESSVNILILIVLLAIKKEKRYIYYLLMFSTTRLLFEQFRVENYKYYFGIPATYFFIVPLIVYSIFLLKTKKNNL